MNVSLDWETSPRTEGLVSIGDHKLFAAVSGPVRKAGQPLVVILPGSGESSSSYPAVERLVSSFARIFLYDRTGLGRSQEGSTRPLSTGAATELHALLTAVQIPPPYLLVGHSYGALISREYLHLYPDDIAGIVLADPSSELNHKIYETVQPLLATMLGSLNYAKVTGLRALSKLSNEEWRTRAADVNGGAPVTLHEGEHFSEICSTLAAKDQMRTQPLGSRPLSIIRCRGSRDVESIYKAGLEAGNGTQEDRERLRSLLNMMDERDKTAKLGMLKLSSNSRLRDLPDCGHNVNIVRPEVIAEEIHWVLEDISRSFKI
jgi:pimeloyl-ACP methyl ester carboxylesterase